MGGASIIVVQLRHPAGQMAYHDFCLQRPCSNASHGGEEGCGRQAQFCQSTIDSRLDIRLSGCVRKQCPGQGTDLHRRVLVSRKLHPGVFFVCLQEVVGWFGT